MNKSLTQVLGQAMVRSAEPGIAKSSLASWFGRRIGLGDSNFWSTFYGADSASGKVVSQQTALQLSTVWSCVRLIAETMATLPIALYEKQGGVPVVAESHPVISRGSRRIVDYDVRVPTEELSRVTRLLDQLRDTVCVYIGTEDLEASITVGRFENLRINISNPSYCEATAEVRSLN